MSSLPLDTLAVDLTRLVQWNPSPAAARYRVGPGDKRAGTTGTVLGTIALRHASGYEVVMLMDGTGKVDSFAPLSLYPDPTTTPTSKNTRETE